MRLLSFILDHIPPKQFFLFCFVGVTGLIVDTIVLASFTETGLLDPRAAAIPAFIVAVTWTFTLNRKLTFSASNGSPVRLAFGIFLAVCLVGLSIRISIMHALIAWAGFGVGRLYYVASLIGIGVATITNFLGSKYLAFRQV